jgi:3-oxoacyl-[acyl-carrier protein] reductase
LVSKQRQTPALTQNRGRLTSRPGVAKEDATPRGPAPMREYAMDLGIAGRKAIVCASSKGLGRACAKSLAEAGCEVVVNGRNREIVEASAADIRQATGAKVIAVAADVATVEGQHALFAACPEPDIVVNNNAGPPFRDFRELTRQHIIDGVIANMVVAIEITQRVIEPMVKRNFGRVINITSGTVKAPLFGLDLSSGARAGLTAFMAGIARSVAAANVTINFMQPGAFATDRLQSNMEMTARKRGIPIEQAANERITSIPAKRLGTPEEFGATCAFLCSTHASYITGQNLLLDGGAFPGAF